MPEISCFFGIIICMYANEHGLPPNALRHVLEWLELHRQELLDNWQTAAGHGKLKKIEPLR
jgi:hypothetical protein